MALQGIMGIGIVIDNTNDVDQNVGNAGNAYDTMPTANVHENMIIMNNEGIT